MALFAFGLLLLYFAEWVAYYGALRVNPGALVFDITLMVTSLAFLALARAESPTLALLKGMIGLINGLGLILLSLYVIYERLLAGRFDIVNALLSPVNVLIGVWLIFTSLKEVGAFSGGAAVFED